MQGVFFQLEVTYDGFFHHPPPRVLAITDKICGVVLNHFKPYFHLSEL